MPFGTLERVLSSSKTPTSACNCRKRSPLPRLRLNPPPLTMYPKGSDLLDTVVYDRPHDAHVHHAEPRFEVKPGGALARCSHCGAALQIVLVVLGTLIPAEQLAWVLEVG